MSKFEKHLEIILREMCRSAWVNYEDIDFEAEDWFMEYSWTEEEEDDFKDWLTDYIYKNKEARGELSTIWHNTKKRCREFAGEFCLNYGWKSEEKNE